MNLTIFLVSSVLYSCVYFVDLIKGGTGSIYWIFGSPRSANSKQPQTKETLKLFSFLVFYITAKLYDQGTIEIQMNIRWEILRSKMRKSRPPRILPQSKSSLATIRTAELFKLQNRISCTVGPEKIFMALLSKYSDVEMRLFIFWSIFLLSSFLCDSDI